MMSNLRDSTLSQYEDDEDSTCPDETEPGLAVVGMQPAVFTRAEVIARIEKLAQHLVESLDDELRPVMTSDLFQQENSDDSEGESNDEEATEQQQCKSNNHRLVKQFTLNQSRSFTSILLVCSYCHALLQSNRTTTTREVYYFYVTHFRSQQECDLAIADAAVILNVPRHALGLQASPRGWFCGDIQLIDKETNEVVVDGMCKHTGPHGISISSEWLLPPSQRKFDIVTKAICVLVIEKEGVYTRLLEDDFHKHHACIMVTGKGFPDMATRAMVHALYTLNNRRSIPIWGLADCNPFGVMVLSTYEHSSSRLNASNQYSVPIQWMGLRPSQVEHLRAQKENPLPQAVLQCLSDLDKNRLENHLLQEGHCWTSFGSDDSSNRQLEQRLQELENMLENGYKVELEALNWLGIDFTAEWVASVFEANVHKEGDGEGDEWKQVI